MTAERVDWNQRMEHQNAGGFFNVLAEVDLFWDSLAKYGYITQEARDYALQNLRTAMVEAVSDNWGEVFVHGRKWGEVEGQRQYVDWGYPFLTGLLFAGLQVPGIPQFELERRRVEYSQEQLMTLARMIVEDKNLPLEGIVVMVSSYPEEYGASEVQELGYRPDERTAKIRAEVFMHGSRKTIELALAQSDLSAWNRVWHKYGHGQSQTTTELLGSWLWFESEDVASEWELIAKIAHDYDRAMAELYGGEYFLGKKVAGARSLQEYVQKFAEHQQAVEGTQLIVDRLVGVVRAMAESMYSGHLSDAVRSRIAFWLTQPGSVLNHKERLMLGEARQTGVVTRELLELIMTKELVISWSMAAAVINPTKVALVLGRESVVGMAELVAEMPRQGLHLDSFELDQWDWWVSSHHQMLLQQFVACGGVVGGIGGFEMEQASFGWSLYQMPLWEVGLVLGGSDESNYVYTCEHCGYKNRINARMGDLIGKNGRTCKCGKVPMKC